MPSRTPIWGSAVLEVRGLTAGYGAVTAIRGIDLTVAAGEVLVVVGPNGAGKSTLLKSLIGVHRQVEGTADLEGRPLLGMRPHTRHKLGVTWIPEGRGIVPELTVEENLDLARFSGRWERSHRDRSLDSFPILQRALRRPAGSLSGGEQQMLALARAWETAPKLLLVDEPSLGLAPVIVDQIIEALGKLRETGAAMLLVEQRAHGVLSIADHAALMNDGRVRDIPMGDVRMAEVSFESYLGVEETPE